MKGRSVTWSVFLLRLVVFGIGWSLTGSVFFRAGLVTKLLWLVTLSDLRGIVMTNDAEAVNLLTYKRVQI